MSHSYKPIDTRSKSEKRGVALQTIAGNLHNKHGYNHQLCLKIANNMLGGQYD